MLVDVKIFRRQVVEMHVMLFMLVDVNIFRRKVVEMHVMFVHVSRCQHL
jgi:hypothetical protein